MTQKTAIWMGTAFAIALAIAAMVLVLGGTGNPGTRLALELTARWSFLLFWLAYAGNAVAILFGVRTLAGHARDFGLAFAAAHLVHIGLIVWLAHILGRAVLPPGLFWFFMAGLFWTYLLAGLSFGGAKALGPTAWRWIRLVGMNYILVAFGRDFVLPVLYPKPAQVNLGHFMFYAPFMVLAIAAPLLVVAAHARRSNAP
jgi:hypothetical protein